MIQWWESLLPRERAILGVGSLVAVLILVWEFAWQPLTQGRLSLQQSVESKQQILGNLIRAGAIVDTQIAGVGTDQSLYVLIDQTARANGLGGALTRARPNGTDEISVTFSNASFDNLVAWLIALNENDGLFVESASINSSRQEGIVSGQLLLRRG